MLCRSFIFFVILLVSSVTPLSFPLPLRSGAVAEAKFQSNSLDPDATGRTRSRRRFLSSTSVIVTKRRCHRAQANIRDSKIDAMGRPQRSQLSPAIRFAIARSLSLCCSKLDVEIFGFIKMEPPNRGVRGCPGCNNGGTSGGLPGRQNFPG